jgi:hypothetical protein
LLLQSVGALTKKIRRAHVPPGIEHSLSSMDIQMGQQVPNGPNWSPTV